MHERLSSLYRAEQAKLHEQLTEVQDRIERPGLDAVSAKVHKLHEREYRAPTRDTPCAEERGACLKCLSENPGSSLNCADTVAALDRCAQSVRQVHLQAAS